MNIELGLHITHIGSMPFKDPEEAVNLSLELDIPAWPQLPKYKNERMIVQFNEGLPGFNFEKQIINTESPNFEEDFMKFYELYLQIVEEKKLEFLQEFSISESFAKGFYTFLKLGKNKKLSKVKGQITGPFTLGIALKANSGESVIFRDELRDLIVKFLTLKALYQGLELKKISPFVILFMDEPGLTAFGTSAFITISKETVLSMINEIVTLVKSHGIFTGIHVCANTSWDVVLESEIDILSFDSFNYYDKLIIYKDDLKKFFETENKFIAWGIIPTDSDTLKSITLQEILEKFNSQLINFSELIGFSKEEILKKSLFTPACGLGSLKEELAIKALKFLKDFKNYISSYISK